MSETETLDYEAVILRLLKKRPITEMERQLSRESGRTIKGLRASAIKTVMELMMGKPLTMKETRYIYSLATSTLRTNQGLVWDHDLHLLNWRWFWRWASK